MDVLTPDWGKLSGPTEYFRIANIDEEAMETLSKHLVEDYLYVDDEYRTADAVRGIMWGHFASGNCLIYEISGGRGYVGFTDIRPGYKASAMMKFWGTDIWGKAFIRQLRELVTLVMGEFKLERISTESPDPRIVKLAKMVGFEVEGVRAKDFRWDGKLYDNILMGYVKEESDVLQGQ